MAFVAVPESAYLSTPRHNVQIKLDGTDIGFLTYRVKVSPSASIPANGMRLYFYTNTGRPDVSVNSYGYSSWSVVDTIHYYNTEHTLNGVTKKHPPMITSDYDPFYHAKFTTCVVMTNDNVISSYSEQSFSISFPSPSGLEFMLTYPVGESIPYGYGNSESTSYEKIASATYKVFDYRHSFSYRGVTTSFKTLSPSVGVVCEFLESGSWKLWKNGSDKSIQHPYQGEFYDRVLRKTSNNVFVVPTYEKCSVLQLRPKTGGVVDSDITQWVSADTIETNNTLLKLSGSYMSNPKRILLSFDTNPLTITGREPEYAELFGWVNSYSAGSTQLDRDYISVIPFMSNAPQWWNNTNDMKRSVLNPFREGTFPLTEQEGLGSWAVSNKYMRFQSFKNLNSGLQKWLNEIRLGTRQERGLSLDFINFTTINIDQPQFLSQENSGVVIGTDTAKGFFITYAQGVRIPLTTNKTLRFQTKFLNGLFVGGDPNGNLITDLDQYDNPSVDPKPKIRVFLSKDDTTSNPIIISDYLTYNAVEKFTADELSALTFTSDTRNNEWTISNKTLTTGGVFYFDIEFDAFNLVLPNTSLHFASVMMSVSDTLPNGDTTNYSLNTQVTPTWQGSSADTILGELVFTYSNPIPSNYIILDGSAQISVSVEKADGERFYTYEITTLTNNPSGVWSKELVSISPDYKRLVFNVTYNGGLNIGAYGFRIEGYESYQVGNDTYIYSGVSDSPTFSVLTIPDKQILFTWYDYDNEYIIEQGYESISFIAQRSDFTSFDTLSGVITLTDGGGSWRIIPESLSLRNGGKEIHGVVEYIGDPFAVGEYSFKLNGQSSSNVVGGVQYYYGSINSPVYTIKPDGDADIIDPDTFASMEDCLIEVSKTIKDRRLVNLMNHIPEVYTGTDVERMVMTFQESLNEVFSGGFVSERYTRENEEFRSLFFDENDQPITDSTASATFTEDQLAIRNSIKEVEKKKYQSILEMIDRLGDLTDAGLIPFQLLRYLALDRGYDFGINIVRSGINKKNKKYLRFLVDNLPTIFASKGTKDGLRGFLHSFGALVSVHYAWTTDYFADWRYSNEADLKDENGVWLSPHEYIPFNSGDRQFIPDGYFLTPHFKLDINITELLDTDEDAIEELFRNIKRAIDWHKPIQCVCDEIKLSIDAETKGLYLKGSIVTEWSGNA